MCHLLGIGDLLNERVIEAVKIFLVNVCNKRSLPNPMNLNVFEGPLAVPSIWAIWGEVD